ncbi:MAG: YesL family protein [Lachnospiraceae bacterium]|nr:YesL family protein [Lachnospiraceae bacterium]
MRRLFDVNNPLMRALTSVFDLIILSVLWAVFSIPVFTMGAASAALYSAVYHHIRKGEDYVWTSFWDPFKENFKRSTLAWLIALVILGLLVFDAIVLRSLWIQNKPFGWLYWGVLVLLAFAVTWTVYLAAYSARFQGTVKDVLKFSFILFRAHPLILLAMMVLVIGGVALALTLPALVIIIPGAVFFGTTFPMEAVFLKHMRPEDLERIQREKEEKDE